MFIELLKIKKENLKNKFPFHNKEISIDNMIISIEKISYDEYNSTLYLKHIHLNENKPHFKENDLINVLEDNINLLLF